MLQDIIILLMEVKVILKKESKSTLKKEHLLWITGEH
jgi:hypothetical protein